MKGATVVDERMRELLERLPVHSGEEPVGGFVRGRALSRTEDSIHVASTYGIVEVPVAAVVDIASRPDDPTIVSLQVSDPSLVRVVRPASAPAYPETVGGTGSGPRMGLPRSRDRFSPVMFGIPGATFSAEDGGDTATVCDVYGPDMTDDHDYGHAHMDDADILPW